MDDLLRTMQLVQTRLDEVGIRSALIGGLAVAAWGRPRMTEDVDFKVEATRSDVPRLLALLAPEFQPAENAHELASSLGVLFLDGPNEVRVDLLLYDLGFDLQALDRAVQAEVLSGFYARICTAEDVIIYKSITTRARDRDDVKMIIVEQGECLDREYVEYWLGQFEVALDDSTLIETFRQLCRPT